MPIMSNMSIKHKLVSIITLTCVGALLLAGGVFVISEWVSVRRLMVRNLSTHAAMTGDNCKAALAFEDANDAEKTLGALKEESSIVFGGVYSKSGGLLQATTAMGPIGWGLPHRNGGLKPTLRK